MPAKRMVDGRSGLPPSNIRRYPVLIKGVALPQSAQQNIAASDTRIGLVKSLDDFIVFPFFLTFPNIISYLEADVNKKNAEMLGVFDVIIGINMRRAVNGDLIRIESPVSTRAASIAVRLFTHAGGGEGVDSLRTECLGGG